MNRLALAAPVVGSVIIVATLLAAADDERGALAAAAAISVVAGLSATAIGVFGAVLVPGLLLLGIEPRVAAPLSLLLQVFVIPLGAGTHALVGHVRRSIVGPLIVGGVVGSVGGALVASLVPATVAARVVAVVIVAVGLVVIANLRSTGSRADRHVGAPPEHGPGTGPGARRIGAIGVVAGIASGVSGAGWGPIGVKLLILAGAEPRHAVGSSLVGRVAMAVAAIATYGVTAAASGALRFDPALFVVLAAGSAASIVSGAPLIGQLGRQRAALAIALISIALALPTVFGWTA